MFTSIDLLLVNVEVEEECDLLPTIFLDTIAKKICRYLPHPRIPYV